MNGSEISKMIFVTLAQEGPMTVGQIASEILEEEEDVSRALHEDEGACVERIHTDEERWRAIPGEDDDEYF